MGAKMDNNSDIYDIKFVKSVFGKCSEKYVLFSYFCSPGFAE
jgi:hypothetical protein